jgi:hypothetical protein
VSVLAMTILTATDYSVPFSAFPSSCHYCHSCIALKLLIAGSGFCNRMLRLIIRDDVRTYTLYLQYIPGRTLDLNPSCSCIPLLLLAIPVIHSQGHDNWYQEPVASLKGICPRGNNKVVIILFHVHNRCLFLMLELY